MCYCSFYVFCAWATQSMVLFQCMEISAPLSFTKILLPRSSMSFYSYGHYIGHHFSYVLPLKQYLRNVELFPSWYPILLIFSPSMSLANPTHLLYGWFFLPFFLHILVLGILSYSSLRILIILADVPCLLLLQFII